MCLPIVCNYQKNKKIKKEKKNLSMTCKLLAKSLIFQVLVKKRITG